MTISKMDDGRYMLDLRPQGRNGKRIRRKFDTRSEALRFERWAISKYNDKEWLAGNAKDGRNLDELITLWWKYHGQTLTSGEAVRLDLERMCNVLGNPKASQVTRGLFADYRAKRLEAGISPVTVNREQSLLSGVFTALKKSGQLEQQNPLTGLPKIKTAERDSSFLTIEQIDYLLSLLDGDNLRLAKFALSTGARWDEAAQMDRSRILKYKAVFTETKGKRNRTVPISEALHDEITKDRKAGKIFPNADYRIFRAVLKKHFNLPDGQATHIMRHSFSSHFMMNGGNILTLQKILGHTTITQTMAYAHLAPDYLTDAALLNPIAKRSTN